MANGVGCRVLLRLRCRSHEATAARRRGPIEKAYACGQDAAALDARLPSVPAGKTMRMHNRLGMDGAVTCARLHERL